MLSPGSARVLLGTTCITLTISFLFTVLYYRSPKKLRTSIRAQEEMSSPPATASSRPSSASGRAGRITTEKKPVFQPVIRKKKGTAKGKRRVVVGKKKTPGGAAKAKFEPNIAVIKKKKKAAPAAQVDLIKLQNRKKRERKQRERKSFTKQASTATFMASASAKMTRDTNVVRTGKANIKSGPKKSELLTKKEKEKVVVKMGEFYPEDESLDNDDLLQRRPIILPFPDIKGEEAYGTEADIEAQEKLKLLNLRDVEDMFAEKARILGVVAPTASAVDDDAMQIERDAGESVVDLTTKAKANGTGNGAVKVKAEEGKDKSEALPLAGFPLHTAARCLDPTAADVDSDSIGSSDRLLFFQLPSHFPISTAAAGKQVKQQQLEQLGRGRGRDRDADQGEKVTEADRRLRAQRARSAKISKIFSAKADHTVTTLPSGEIGKMMVYKSGKVKLQLGDSLLEVSRGVGCLYHQELVGITTDPNHRGRNEFNSMGPVLQRLICSLDVSTMLKQIETAKKMADAAGDADDIADAGMKSMDSMTSGMKKKKKSNKTKAKESVGGSNGKGSRSPITIDDD